MTVPTCPVCGAVAPLSISHCGKCGRGLPWGIGLPYFADKTLIKKAKDDAFMIINSSTHDLLGGIIEAKEWQKRLKPEVVIVQFASAAEARKKPFNVRCWEKLFPAIQAEVTRLAALAKDFEANPKKHRTAKTNRDGALPFMVQAMRLESMGHCTYENIRMWEAMEEGCTKAARVSAHPPCCKECAALDREDMVDITTFKPLGTTESGGDCNCAIITQR